MGNRVLWSANDLVILGIQKGAVSHKTEPGPPIECLRVSCKGMGQQWPDHRNMGTLAAAVSKQETHVGMSPF